MIRRKSSSKLLLLIAIGLIVLIGLAVAKTTPKTTIGDTYIDLASILGPNWAYDTRPNRYSLQDIKGSSPSLLAVSNMTATYIENAAFVNTPFVYVRIFEYVDAESAEERYLIQDGTLFYQLPDRDSTHWEDMIRDDFNANQYHIACRNSESESVGEETQCQAIFLYNNRIATANIWLVRTSIEVISIEQMNQIFNAIDETLNTLDTSEG